MRCGFALQLVTVRYLGCFLADPPASPDDISALRFRDRLSHRSAWSAGSGRTSSRFSVAVSSGVEPVRSQGERPATRRSPYRRIRL
ncbi:hypothetical protein [Nonomuraea cypriaca]|uniref:hypothetical protein n=1 Tax=Nonomuraea cypriaca TaxID=1187855 RepID=UPI0038B24AC8